MLDNKIILITGGTGSFGNAAVKRFLKTNVAEIRIFSRDEKKQHDMRLKYHDPRLKFYIGDVRDFGSLAQAMLGVDYVFHAAALKQVPSCEFYPIEAVKTNVLGTENVLNAAVNSNVERVVVLSTDKAVYPINAMGISKAMAEKTVVAKARLRGENGPIMCCTRYGNVISSRGSVIPLFIDQIRSGRPVTITEPGMTRFLMSLDESVELVLHAFQHGEQGDIFVKKAPAATVDVLADALQSLLQSEVEKKFIGIRHGEKLYETLISREEMARAEEEDGFYRIPVDDRDLNYENFFEYGESEIAMAEDYTSHNTFRLNQRDVERLLMKIDALRAAMHA